MNSRGEITRALEQTDAAELMAQTAPNVPETVERLLSESARRLFDSSDSPLSEGAVLGAYRIEKTLGEGGQAVVYQARHQQLGRRVALKVPRKQSRARLIREARLAVRLEHEGFARIEDIQEDGETPFLVMELCSGGNIADLLRDNPSGLPIGQVRALSSQILEALTIAHERNVVHRDIKPSNLLISDGGRLKIADLGIGTLASLPSDLERSSAFAWTTNASIAGTPLYMAPEQGFPRAASEGTVDGRADLYSFGKVLYTMLTGAPPATIRPPSNLRPELNPGWDRLVFRLLEDDPKRRLKTAGEVLEALMAVPDEASGEARVTTETSRSTSVEPLAAVGGLRRIRLAYLIIFPSTLAALAWSEIKWESFETLPGMLIPSFIAAWIGIGLLSHLISMLGKGNRRGGSFVAYSFATVLGLWFALLSWAALMYRDEFLDLAALSLTDLGITGAATLIGWGFWRRI